MNNSFFVKSRPEVFVLLLLTEQREAGDHTDREAERRGFSAVEQVCILFCFY